MGENEVTVALVVGLGSAGCRHARILKDLVPGARVVGLSRADRPVPDVDLIVRSVEDALLERPTVAIVSGPATTRIAVSLRLAAAGVHLLLEKPLASELRDARELEALVAANGLTAAVGYNLRFFEPLLAAKELVDCGAVGRLRSARVEVGQYLPDWRPGVDHRTTVSAQRSLGGGALLELSHELDYLLWIMGRPAKAWATLVELGDLELDVEDTTEIVVMFRSGAVASVHQDMLQRPAVRLARFVGERGSVVADLIRGTTTVSEPGSAPYAVVSAAADVSVTYRAQLDDFLTAVHSTRAPAVPLSDGIAALELADAARRSSATGCVVNVGGDG